MAVLFAYSKSCFRTVAGEMAEWLKAHAWKACLGETLTWVRIPLSPPDSTALALSQITTNHDALGMAMRTTFE